MKNFLLILSFSLVLFNQISHAGFLVKKTVKLVENNPGKSTIVALTGASLIHSMYYKRKKIGEIEKQIESINTYSKMLSDQRKNVQEQINNLKTSSKEELVKEHARILQTSIDTIQKGKIPHEYRRWYADLSGIEHQCKTISNETKKQMLKLLYQDDLTQQYFSELLTAKKIAKKEIDEFSQEKEKWQHRFSTLTQYYPLLFRETLYTGVALSAVSGIVFAGAYLTYFLYQATKNKLLNK